MSEKRKREEKGRRKKIRHDMTRERVRISQKKVDARVRKLKG
jgi:hypothetical protein